MKKFYVFLFVLVMASLLASCHKVDEWWTEATDSVPPGKVRVVDTIGISGGVKIVIERPNDPDLLGVKALYTMNKTHENLEAFISAFTDTIVLAGFGDTDVHEVTLVAVDKSLNESEPVTTNIRALPNVIETIMASLEVYDGFGGLYVSWKNPSKEDIALSLSVWDEMIEDYDLAVPLIYNNNVNFGQTIKGLEMDTPKKYRLEILDRWRNYSTPRDIIGTPLYEINLPSKNELGEYVWNRYQYDEELKKDNPVFFRGEVANFTPLWEGMDESYDNTLGWDAGSEPGNFNLGSNAGRTSMTYPMYYIMDMGRKASYSSYIFYQRRRDPLGSADFPVEFEIWGTNIPPKETSEIGDGSKLANLQYWTSWDIVPGGSAKPDLVVNGQDTWKTDPEGGWVRLDSCSYKLPSGIRKGIVGNWPNNPLSAEDQDFINAGILYELKNTTPVRYLRFVIYETSKDDRKLTILEQYFRGAYVDD